MSDNTLVDKTDDQVIEAADPNQYKTALGGDIVSRNSSGVPAFAASKAGTSTYPFKQAHITVGDLFTGMILPMFQYDGLLTPGQGWYPCDGTLINKTNYDAVHGAGSWDTYIVSSALDGKYSLPAHGAKQLYLVGADDTTQDGSGPFTTVGNEDHTYDLPDHTHDGPLHTHNITRSIQSVFNSGVIQGLQTMGTQTGADGNDPTSDGGGVPRTIKPKAIPVQFFIRIV